MELATRKSGWQQALRNENKMGKKGTLNFGLNQKNEVEICPFSTCSEIQHPELSSETYMYTFIN